MVKRGKRGRPQGSQNVAKLILKDKLEAHVDEALATVAACMQSENERIRLDAACYVLDQVHGKARQRLDVGGDTPIQHKVTIEIVRSA
jgi:hypothetical protein